jgi:hypothetical protein
VVATPAALYALKKGTVRPLDRQRGRVERFRSIEEMSRAPDSASSGDGFERFARHCARYGALSPPSYPRGVFKFRSIEEAQAPRAVVSSGGRLP